MVRRDRKSESSPVDPRESERRHEARHRAPESGGGERGCWGGSRRGRRRDDDDDERGGGSASDRGWDVGEDASVAEEEDSSLRVVKDGHVFVGERTCCVRRAWRRRRRR